ncbi:DNA polymerase I [Gleimia europaea]|uniref:DNA polymerase I n=1 Tax=Gleimia europaea ACS-120-V-Col10b TaxID=883069 RepID=A0A9W5RDL9_9ACTO|nr:DNA polymerase I [Gleimia europaea]EPD30524.1 DNA polymerase I [Gleimia europaea ACS-120-V-Col10b]
MSEKRLLVLDGHSMAFRAFYALPVESFMTSTGQHTNAVYGFVSMLVKMLADYEPTHVLAAFDAAEKSFRSDEYPEYKAGRAKTPEEFKSQVPLIQEVLKKLDIPVVVKEGVEADDVLATVSSMAQEAGMETLLASGDRDTFQLVTDSTFVIYPGRSMSDLRLMDPPAVTDRYGVVPAQYPEIAALVGESADNLPGVPGVGDKTAAQWLQKFGGLDELLENAEKVGGKRGEALREHLEDVRRNRRLNALLRDVELDVSLDDLERKPFDRNGIEELFDTLEFATLRSRVFAVDVADEVAAPAEPVSEATEVETVTYPQVGIDKWAQSIADDDLLAVLPSLAGSDIEVVVLYAPGKALVVDPVELDEAGAAELQALFDRTRIVTHEAKKWRHLFAQRGIDFGNVWLEAELAAYLLRPDQRGYELTALARRYLERTVADAESDGQLSLLSDHAQKVQLAQALFDLEQPMRAELQKQDAWELFQQMELPVQNVLWKMERVGIGADMDSLRAMSDELGGMVNRAAEAAYEVIGHEVNLSSPKQLQTVLFDELDMPKTKKTKTGYTTNADALEKLFLQTEHPFLAHLLEHRDKIKLHQTVDGLIGSVRSDGRIHTTFEQTKAATGRLSSTQPNLQNIPARTEEGLRIREAFVPGDGFDALLTADYSQIEMRIMAHMSEDVALIEAFNSGEDLHKTMASMVFHVPVEEVDSNLRSRIKATSYGLAYGLSSYGLSQQLGISVGEASELRDKYFERFGGVQDFLASVVANARKVGYTTTLFGRRRYLPDLNSTNRQRREMAQRAALNAPIQGSAADIIKVAMIHLDSALAESGLSSRVLLQVHDELVLEIKNSEKDEIQKLVKHAMSNAVALDVPLDVSMGIGDNWRSAGH